ncbi:retrovirus-related pol polyprotein from transposon TNT 1-94 [Tanacetum coccineum]
MSTPVSTSSTDSQMHNNIMAAGSKDRPPMLGPGRNLNGDHLFYGCKDQSVLGNWKLLLEMRIQESYTPKQFQKEVNDIRAERIAKSANPFSIHFSVSDEDNDPEQAQRDKEMQKNLILLAKLKIPTKGITKTNQSRQLESKDNTVAGARETVGSQVMQQTGIQCFNCKGYGHYAKECRKPKRVKDYAYHKEKMMMCKQAEQGVPLQAEQADWLEDTDEE